MDVSHLLLPHLGELVEEGEVLRQVLAVGLDAVLHDGQQRLHEAGDAGAAADVLHRAVHVVRAADDRDNGGWSRRSSSSSSSGARPETVGDSPVLHPRLQVQVSVDRPQPLDDVNAQPLEHLGDRGGRLDTCLCSHSGRRHFRCEGATKYEPQRELR